MQMCQGDQLTTTTEAQTPNTAMQPEPDMPTHVSSQLRTITVNVSFSGGLNTFLKEYTVLGYFPCDKMFDHPVLVGCSVSLTLNKHQQQKEGKSLQKKCFASLFVCVSVVLLRTAIKTKSTHCNQHCAAAVRNMLITERI